VVASSHEARSGPASVTRRHRASLQSLGQTATRARTSHKLPYRHVPNEDENVDSKSVNYDAEFGRKVAGDANEDFGFSTQLTLRDSDRQRQLLPASYATDKRRVGSDRRAWKLPTPPDTPSPATPLDTGHFASFATTAVPIGYKMAFLLNFCRYHFDNFHVFSSSKSSSHASLGLASREARQ
jgi:hypothetical protein